MESGGWWMMPRGDGGRGRRAGRLVRGELAWPAGVRWLLVGGKRAVFDGATGVLVVL